LQKTNKWQHNFRQVSLDDGGFMKRLLATLLLLSSVAAPGNSQAPSAQSKALSVKSMGANKTTWSVADFGAVGDGKTDDTAALRAAFSRIETEHGGCLYVPSGIYITSAQLNWTAEWPLCLLGESHFKTVIYYTGRSQVDSTLYARRPTGFVKVRIENISFAANQNARYAFHAIQAGASSMSNVAFSGGSSSAFEGDFWNGQRDLANLMVEPGAIDGVPFSCVNGLTFASGPLNGTSTTMPSTQFTLTSPAVMYCTGTGLNIQGGEMISVTSGQLSTNHQNLFDKCATYGCNAPGNVFTGLLVEAGKEDDAIYNRSIFLGLMCSLDTVDTYADATFIGSQLHLNAMPGTRAPTVMSSWIKDMKDSSSDGIQSTHNFSIQSGARLDKK
jgi:hypothetical protein